MRVFWASLKWTRVVDKCVYERANDSDKWNYSIFFRHKLWVICCIFAQPNGIPSVLRLCQWFSMNFMVYAKRSLIQNFDKDFGICKSKTTYSVANAIRTPLMPQILFKSHSVANVDRNTCFTASPFSALFARTVLTNYAKMERIVRDLFVAGKRKEWNF